MDFGIGLYDKHFYVVNMFDVFGIDEWDFYILFWTMLLVYFSEMGLFRTSEIPIKAQDFMLDLFIFFPIEFGEVLTLGTSFTNCW